MNSSPFEHQARILGSNESHGKSNFKGFYQYRKMIQGEFKPDTIYTGPTI